MYIGLISDTHGVFSPQFRDFLVPVDEIWHAGDWGGDADFPSQITSLHPVVGVHGNCDGPPVRQDYPEFQFFERGGMNVLMMHIGGWPGHYDLRAAELIRRFKPQLFVCGHSHILKVMNDDRYGMLTVNPGACGLQGWQVVRTALRFRIEDGKVSDMEVLNLPR